MRIENRLSYGPVNKYLLFIDSKSLFHLLSTVLFISIIRCKKVLHWPPDLDQDLQLSALSNSTFWHHWTRWKSTPSTVALHEPRVKIWPAVLSTLNKSCPEEQPMWSPISDLSQPFWRNHPSPLGKRGGTVFYGLSISSAHYDLRWRWHGWKLRWHLLRWFRIQTTVNNENRHKVGPGTRSEIKHA